MLESVMGILKRLFGGGDPTTQSTVPGQEAEKIIQAYGALLQAQPPAPGRVADARKLPFPKERIKAALIFGLKATNDQQMNWQEGVGENDIGLDLSNEDLYDDPVKLAQKIVDQGSGHKKWQPIIKAEQEKLQKELVDLGLW
jgi:hypothetical protein